MLYSNLQHDARGECGEDMGILCGILPISHNIVMDMNNVMCLKMFTYVYVLNIHTRLSVYTSERKSPLGKGNSPAIEGITCDNEICFRRI
jgi:hypothetical protein